MPIPSHIRVAGASGVRPEPRSTAPDVYHPRAHLSAGHHVAAPAARPHAAGSGRGGADSRGHRRSLGIVVAPLHIGLSIEAKGTFI